MANKYFRGDAPATTQITEWVFGGTWEATDVIIVTINGKSVSVVAGGTAITGIVDAIVTALGALSATAYPEFAEITWDRNGNNLRGTMKVAGKPFAALLETTETGGGSADAQTIDGSDTSAGVDTVACTGPSWLNEPLNWSGGSLPSNGDDVIFSDCKTDILYGLVLSAVNPATIRRYQSFTGKIGLPRINTDGAATYLEYRGQYAKFGASGGANNIQVYLGLGEGQGPSREKWDFSDGQATVNGLNTGTPVSGEREACLIVGTHASNEFYFRKGTYGVAVLPAESSNVATLSISYDSNQQTDCRVRCGVGCTLLTVTKTGGYLEVNGLVDTILKNHGGNTEVNGAANLDAIEVYGGDVYVNTTGTVGGNPVVVFPGRIIFDRDLRAKTVTNPIEVYGKDALKRVIDNNQVVSNLRLDLNLASDDGVPLGTNIRMTRGTPS